MVHLTLSVDILHLLLQQLVQNVCCKLVIILHFQWMIFMQFPPEFETGDGADVRLPNHVFNQLKVHSKVDNKRGHRVHEKKEHATAVCII